MDLMHPRDEKEELRQSIKERLTRMSSKDRIAEGRSLSRRIIEALPKNPMTIAAYMPMPREADITMLLNQLLEKNYPLYLPRGEGGKLVFRQVANLAALSMGVFGVLEPPASAPLLDPKDLAIAIVPGLAFDRKGNRLGRGNGGFDVWIRAQRSANPKTQFWGVLYECQLVPSIPMEEHDESVDALITARGLHRA